MEIVAGDSVKIKYVQDIETKLRRNGCGKNIKLAVDANKTVGDTLDTGRKRKIVGQVLYVETFVGDALKYKI